MTARGLALCALMLAGLAACGSDTDQTAGARAIQAFAQQSVRFVVRTDPTVAPDTPAGLTRADLAQVPAEVQSVTVESRGAAGLVVKTGENSGVETWTSADSKSVSLRGGVLVATRGLGADLIAASVPGAAQIAAGGAWTRVHTTLDGLDQALRETIQCRAEPAGPASIVILERRYATRLVREECQGDRGSRFVNEYWFDQRASLRQSRQWVAAPTGYVAIRRLAD